MMPVLRKTLIYMVSRAMRCLLGCLLLGAGLWSAACPIEPCCGVDSDCPDALICVEGQCTYRCKSSLDCDGHEICLVQEHLGKQIGTCVDPGAEKGQCPTRTPRGEGSVGNDGGSTGTLCLDDDLEHNDSLQEATPAEPRFIELMICPEDTDWFVVELTMDTFLNVEIRFFHVDGDLDLRLLDESGDMIQQSTSVANVESISMGALNAGTYYAHVYGYAQSQNQYDIEFEYGGQPQDGGTSTDGGTICTDAFEPNDSAAQATTNWSSPAAGNVCNGNDDYFQVLPQQSGAGFLVEGSILFEHADGDIDVQLLDADFAVVHVSQSGSDDENISYTTQSSAPHVLRIFGFNSAANDYVIDGFATGGMQDDCGNGNLDEGEECDDGNQMSGDGCDADCQLELPAAWTCEPAAYFDESCDCGCGAFDLSCMSNLRSACEESHCPDSSLVVETENHLCYMLTCGNDLLDDGEECDDGNNVSGDGCDATCRIESFCGDGILDEGEECDDANMIGDDGCSTTCEIEIPDAWSCSADFFGDGPCDCGCSVKDVDCPSILGSACHIIHCPEEATLDDDNNPNCIFPSCGNGDEDNGEECDDGNTIPGDGCDQNCREESVCGDSEVEGAEACDDGNLIDGDGCSAACQVEIPALWSCNNDWYGVDDGCDCGCGIIDSDCSNATSDACDYNNCPMMRAVVEDNNAFCVYDSCGNGMVDPTEQCDDGNNVSGDGCSHVCREEAICGDGDPDPPDEECDDGNTVSGDGCTSNCRLELSPDWVCNDNWFLDGSCDCGCGAFDADCDNETIEACDFEFCEDSFVDPDQNWLCIESMCDDDEFEDNDESENPAQVQPGEFELVLCPEDRDYFIFDVPQDSLISLQLIYEAPPGMELAIGRENIGVIQESTDGNGEENIQFAPNFPGEFIVRVLDDNEGPGDGRPYTLSIIVE